MTYQEFKNKYNGKYIDYDGAYGCQCWDLVQYYNVEVLNVPDSVFSGCGWVKNMVLWDWKYQEMMKYFDEVDTRDMHEGDVVIWTGGDGHVAIFDNYDGECWFFSQNPNPCQVMLVKMSGIHAFRRKQETPPAPPEPTPVITPNVPRDEYKDQIEVLVDNLRIRTSPGLDGKEIGYANPGYYNCQESTEKDGYTWYRISDTNWIASKEGEWTKYYPKKEDKYIELKVLEEKEGMVLVDIGQVWIKKETQL